MQTQISLLICSLISVFLLCIKKLCILGYPKFVQRRFWSDCVNAMVLMFSDVTAQYSCNIIIHNMKYSRLSLSWIRITATLKWNLVPVLTWTFNNSRLSSALHRKSSDKVGQIILKNRVKVGIQSWIVGIVGMFCVFRLRDSRAFSEKKRWEK